MYVYTEKRFNVKRWTQAAQLLYWVKKIAAADLPRSHILSDDSGQWVCHKLTRQICQTHMK